MSGSPQAEKTHGRPPHWRTGPWHRLYGTERWRRRARRQMRDEPLCRMCQARGQLTPAQVADHVEPHGGDINKFWLGALQSLCKPCHEGPKRLLEQRGYLPDIGLDGWPIDPRHPAYGVTVYGCKEGPKRPQPYNQNESEQLENGE